MKKVLPRNEELIKSMMLTPKKTQVLCLSAPQAAVKERIT
jgi:hypothetical protein